MMAEPTGGMVAGIASVDAILRLAKYAPVFPCRRRDEEGFSNGRPVTFFAKSPLTDNGFYAATQEEQQIRDWWRRWPEALVGVPTGQRTKLVAIDWDPDKHSDATGEWIQTHAEALMLARIHGTMRGGKHYVYRINGGIYKTGTDIELGGVKRSGIDLRGDGGYVIWWPIHGGSVTNDQAPFLPAGLIDERLDRPGAPSKALPTHTPAEWKREKINVADALAWVEPGGDRDTWRDVGMAIHLASIGSDDGFQLWHSWSAGELTGEMPGNYQGIDDCRYAWDSFKDKTAKPVRLGTIFHKAKAAGWTPPKKEPAANEEQKAPSFTAPQLTSIMTSQSVSREWFFEEILPAGAFLIVGRPKVGKSWLLLQLAYCAASCTPFLGYQPLGQYGVLYITAEDDTARIQSRFRKFEMPAPPGLHVLLRDDFIAAAIAHGEQFSLTQYLDGYLTQNPDVKLAIIDTESTCRHIWDGENGGSKERSITRKDYAEVRAFDSIALKHRAFIGLVNHTAKRKNGTWFDIHELINRTNTALAGASGSIVIADPPGHDPMDTESRIRVLGIRGRDISGDHLIAIEQGSNGVFVSRGKWTAYSITEAQEQICAALLEINEESPGQWITSKEVAHWIQKTPGAVQRAVTRMGKAGKLEYEGFRFEVKKKQGIRLHKVST